MRIHTNTLTDQDLNAAVQRAGLSLDNLHVTWHGSRSRDRAVNVYLTGSSSRMTNSRSGDYAHAGHAATWDEWGMFLAELFRRDPSVTIPKVYDSAEHFRWATFTRYDYLTPAEQHGKQGHKWEYVANVTGSYTLRECKCGATYRQISHGRSFESLSLV